MRKFEGMKKLLSALLVLSMILSFVPMGARAEDCGHVHDESCGGLDTEGAECQHSCDICNPPVHTHSYGSYGYDENGHWQDCEAEGCDENKGRVSGSHSFDSDTDTDCVCGYVRTVTPVCSCDSFCRGQNYACAACAEDMGLCKHYEPTCFCVEKCTPETVNTSCDICGQAGADLTLCKGEDMGVPLATTYSDFKINGKPIAGELVDGKITLDSSDTGYGITAGTVVFTPADGTNPAKLEMNNAIITTDSTSGVKTENNNLELVLTGDNTITCTGSRGVYVYNADLTVSGTGSLEATSSKTSGINSYGVEAKNIMVTGASLTGISGNLSDNLSYSYGVCATGGGITVHDGSLTGKGGTAPANGGVCATSGITVTGNSYLKAVGNNSAAVSGNVSGNGYYRLSENDGFTATTEGTAPHNNSTYFEFQTSAPTYTVTVTTPTNGTVNADPTSAAAGTEVTLTVTPKEGYELDTLTAVDASGDTVTITDNKFTMPASNVTVTASFKKIAVPGISVTIKPAQLALNDGQVTQVTAYISPENATNQTVTWSSENEHVVTVDPNGLVEAKDSGNTTIQAEVGGHTATCAVHVHRWLYRLKENTTDTIDYVCEIDQCPYTLPKTIQIIANNGSYDGEEKKASLEYTNWNGTPFSNLIVYFYKQSEAANYTEPQDMTKAGYYKASITLGGVAAYVEYFVSAKALNEENVTVSGTLTYNGTVQVPVVTVEDGDKILTCDTEGTPGDYTVTYMKDGVEVSNPTNAGEYAIWITGVGNYSGTITKTFTINPKELTDENISLDKESFVFKAGTTQIPVVTVEDGDKILTCDTEGTPGDYTVTYMEVSNPINAGEYAIRITGVGNYSGTITKTFTITPKELTDENISLDKEAFVFKAGTTQIPVVTVRDGDKSLTCNTQDTPGDYVVVYLDKDGNKADAPCAAGTYTVAVYGIAELSEDGSGNYSGTATKTFTITPKSLNDITVELSDTVTFEGEKAPAVTVKDGNTGLVEDTDYEMTVESKDNAEFTITITGKGNYTGTKTLHHLLVNLPDPDEVEPDDKSAIDAYELYTGYNEKYEDAELKKALEELQKALTDYKITKGHKSSYVKGSYKSLSFTANGYYGKFTGVEVDGETLDPKYYTAKSGSTVITLKYGYLESLKSGKHTIQVNYTDGNTGGKDYFRISVNNGSPITGDDSHMMFFGGLAMTALLGMAALILFRPRKKGRYQR